MDEQNLATEISDYISKATGLEATRIALVDRIADVVRAEIIPEITPLLPEGYTIDSERVEVRGVGGEPIPHSKIRKVTRGSVPTGFGVTLRLLYDGKPIGGGNVDVLKQVGEIQELPKLEELAQKYNLNSITPRNEPVRMN